MRGIEEFVTYLESAFQRTFFDVSNHDAVALATLRKVTSYAKAYRMLGRGGHVEEAICLARVIIEAWVNYCWMTEHEDQVDLRVGLLGYKQLHKKREVLQDICQLKEGQISEPARDYLRQTKHLEQELAALAKRNSVNVDKADALRKKHIEDCFGEINQKGLHQSLYAMACSAIHTDGHSLQAYFDGEWEAMRFSPPREILLRSSFDDIVYALLLDTAKRVNQVVALSPTLDDEVNIHHERQVAILGRRVSS